MGMDEEAAPIPEATGSNGAADDYFDYMDDAIPAAYGYEGKWRRSVATSLFFSSSSILSLFVQYSTVLAMWCRSFIAKNRLASLLPIESS